ncbi:hypothetical protein V6N12_040272 [Hibiscus sabdariffa]|uniref:Uncharacterized protein n=1 Tax=Hibiscus sabdariffa TaxID=183260 RepID=A0ABR2E394_9ROSI
MSNQMENPSGETNPNFALADGFRSALATGGLLLGNKCGRPPENVIHMEDDSVLERHGSPVDVDIQPACKKGRNFEDSSEVLMQSDSMHSAERGLGLESNSHSGGQEHGLSFRDTLMGGIEDVVEISGAVDAARGDQADPNQVTPMQEENREGEAQKVMEVVSPRRRTSAESREPTADGIRLGKDLRKPGSFGGKDQDDQPMVAAQGVIRHGKTSLNSVQHTVVTVDESENNTGIRNATGRVLPASLRGGSSLGSVKKGAGLPLGQKGSLKPRKKDVRGPSSSTLAASLAPLVAELESAGRCIIEGREHGSTTAHYPVQWKSNSAFELPGCSNMHD